MTCLYSISGAVAHRRTQPKRTSAAQRSPASAAPGPPRLRLLLALLKRAGPSAFSPFSFFYPFSVCSEFKHLLKFDILNKNIFKEHFSNIFFTKQNLKSKKII
jgi:hypothetical protein